MLPLPSRLPQWIREPRTWRWIIVGFGTTAANLVLLYVLVDKLAVAFVFAPLISGEVSLIFRFLVIDRWVFGHRHPTWKRLGEYHLAAAGGFALWWTVSNVLVLLGTHYLLAALLAIGSSLALGLFTNFRWIWRNRPPAMPPAP